MTHLVTCMECHHARVFNHDRIYWTLRMSVWLLLLLLHLVLQPWVSLGLLDNQSPLFSIPDHLFLSFHLHPFQIILNLL
jgi:hypothetical protein